MSTLALEKQDEVRVNFARQGFMTSVGAEIIALDHGRCVIALPFAASVGQQQGFFHGGVIGALADAAGGYATLTTLPSGSDVLTLEYKINFLRPAAGERLIADGVVLRAGRSVSVTRVDIHVERDGRKALCAAMQQSIMTAPTSANA